MENVKPEEKSPLLLYLVDNDCSDHSKNNKRFNFDKGRLYGITSGATAVFTEFPNYINSCWITTILSSLIFFIMMVLMISSISYSPIRVPRCVHRQNDEIDNGTIHLVHNSLEWSQYQLDILQKIQEKYSGFKVHIIVLHHNDFKLNDLQSTKNVIQLKQSSAIIVPHENTTKIATTTNRISKRDVTGASKEIKHKKINLKRIRNRKLDEAGFGLNMGVKRLLDMILHSRSNLNGSIIDAQFPTEVDLQDESTTEMPKAKNIDDILRGFPNLIFENMTYQEAFRKSPLEKTWPRLNTHLTIFAVRVIQLWQYGGLSFCIDDGRQIFESSLNFSVVPEVSLLENNFLIPPPPYASNKLIGFINTGRESFEKLPVGVVTADDEGLHIFSKIPCHAFFGEVILNLKYARRHQTVKHIIRKSLHIFCRHSAVGKKYCESLLRKNG